MAIILETDTEILEAYHAGQRERALTAFVRKHQRFVLSVAYRQLNSMDDARDAAQDVFLRVTQKLVDFRADSSLQTWLYRITVNVCISMRRKRALMMVFAFGEAEGEREVTANEASPESKAITTDFESFFNNVLKTLPAKQRETFCMRYYNELSYQEISAITGTSEGALKASYHWAVKKIAIAVRSSEYYESWREK